MSGYRGTTDVAVLARLMTSTLITVSTAALPCGVSAQDTTPDTALTASAQVDEGTLPFFVTLGLGYGPRIDGCAQCPDPVSTNSFTAHLSFGRYLVDKLAIGLDASAWRRGQPAGTETVATRLVGHVGNASVVLSYERWHVFVRGGAGIAFAQQDVLDDTDVVRARGWGVGYTAGVGATVPLVSFVSLVAFANYNTGWYDLETPTAIIEQSAGHRFIETGFGLTIR